MHTDFAEGIITSVTAKGHHRGIAQLVEYRSPKPWVAGSNPPAPAKIIRTHSSECVLIILLAVLCDEEHLKFPLLAEI